MIGLITVCFINLNLRLSHYISLYYWCQQNDCCSFPALSSNLHLADSWCLDAFVPNRQVMMWSTCQAHTTEQAQGNVNEVSLMLVWRVNTQFWKLQEFPNLISEFIKTESVGIFWIVSCHLDIMLFMSYQQALISWLDLIFLPLQSVIPHVCQKPSVWHPIEVFLVGNWVSDPRIVLCSGNICLILEMRSSFPQSLR